MTENNQSPSRSPSAFAPPAPVLIAEIELLAGGAESSATAPESSSINRFRVPCKNPPRRSRVHIWSPSEMAASSESSTSSIAKRWEHASALGGVAPAVSTTETAEPFRRPAPCTVCSPASFAPLPSCRPTCSGRSPDQRQKVASTLSTVWTALVFTIAGPHSWCCWPASKAVITSRMSRGGGGRCCPSGGGGERERARLLPPSSSRSSSCRRLRLLRLLLLLLLPTPWVGGAERSTETSFVAARAALCVAKGDAVAMLARRVKRISRNDADYQERRLLQVL